MWLLIALIAAALAEDVRDLANAWKRMHNEAVDLHNAGDDEAALALAREALRLAPSGQDTRTLILVAEIAGEQKQYIEALNALDQLAEREKVPWGVFYNGAITARVGGYPASAYRYAREALARTQDQQALVAPVYVSTAMDIAVTDKVLLVKAVEGSALIPDSEELYLRADLVRVLMSEGRCADATAVAARLPEDPERAERLSACVTR
ncbi:MAG: hypothetical protein H6739_40990 [Alphaproteobacteria bacterium]|nr:hypothetical protein [Alphaproteobacteria bacterium]